MLLLPRTLSCGFAFVFCFVILQSWDVALSVAQDKNETRSPLELKTLRSVAEKSNYLATANDKQVLDFLQTLDDASPFASQITLGNTLEGRPIQALVVAKETKPTLPLSANDPRLVILMIGGIHSGECDGKEALLALARDLLSNTSAPKYLEDAVLIFVPNFNADGNARVGSLHRPGQEGPDVGMGTRENAVGLDLNRDFIKLDTPEVRALVRAMDVWDVDVLIDAHTTNGSLHQYDLTYDIPHNPAANPAIVRWLRQEMLPEITTELAAKGLPTFYYGNFSSDHKRWESFGHEPRYSTEYMGLRGKIGILVESYSYASYQRRIEASYQFIDACLRQLTGNARKIQTLLMAAQSSRQKELPIQGKVVADSQSAIAKGYAWKNASDSAERAFPSPRDRKRLDEMNPVDFDVQVVNVGVPLLTIEPPAFYFIGVNEAWAASRLRMHGVQLSWLDASTATKLGNHPASQYRIKARRDLNEFQNPRMAKLETVREQVEWIPSSGWLVSTQQPLGHLASYLLEPLSDDSLAVWNFFDPGLQVESIYPIVRIEKTLDAPPVMKKLGLLDSPASDMAKEPLTLAKIYDPKTRIAPTSPQSVLPRWLPNGESYLIQQDGRWMAVECRSGAMQPFDRPRRLVEALSKLDAFKDGQASEFLRRIDVFDSTFDKALIEHKGQYYWFQIGREGDKTPDSVRQLTHEPQQKKELAELSPSGKHLAFVHDNNLWVANTDSTEVKKLTNDGGAEILNGKLDWVYQEEIYGRGQFKGYWWSPDGRWIAYLRLDENPVPRFQIDNSLTFAQTLEEMRYPKSGQPNPIATLHVVDVASGKQQEVPLQAFAALDRLIVRVGWNPLPGKSEVVFQVQNRIQSKLDVCAFDLQAQKLRTLTQESSPAWVDVIDVPRWLPDGSFLWLRDSERGRRHVVRITPDGTRLPVTDGDWDVKSIEAVSDDGAKLWILGHRSSPVDTDFMQIDLQNSALKIVGEAGGSRRISLNSKSGFYFESWGDSKTPNKTWLRDLEGRRVRYVGGYQTDRMEYLNTNSVELFQIPARDGFPMQSLLYKPTDFAKRSQVKKLPVLIYAYGGPAAPSVENTWTRRSDLWHRYLAEQGICVLICDNRSSLGRGNSDTWKIYKDLGAVELRDLEDAVAWLTKQTWADTERLGMWGWSYGGYFTSYAMTHCKLFRAGIAGAPVTDWNNYDSVYTERYMDTPQANPAGYKTSSVVGAAKDLHGHLMLIHGEIDDNVHMANTMQLVHALQKSNKQFELMVYPNNRHGIADPDQMLHQYQMMTNFFAKHLLDR
jgi:dipeptidyl-peptidase 4